MISPDWANLIVPKEHWNKNVRRSDPVEECAHTQESRYVLHVRFGPNYGRMIQSDGRLFPAMVRE